MQTKIRSAALLIMIGAVLLISGRCLAQQNRELDLHMRLTKTSILLGEPDWVDVRITNATSEALRVDTSPACFMFNTRPLEVEIPAAQPGSGEALACEGTGGDCYGTWADIKPGEALTERYVLSGDFRITHPGSYKVLLKKVIRYEPLPSANPAKPVGPLKQEQIADAQVTLNVIPADPNKLLGIEQALAQEASGPINLPPFPTSTNGQPVAMEAIRRAEDDRRTIQARTVQVHNSIAEGLAAYPAAGMEPVFRVWLERGTFDAANALRRLNTPAAREVLAQDAESSVASRPQRLAAVTALADMGDKEYLPLLEKLTRDSDHDVAEQAIFGLGRLGGEDELPTLSAIAHDNTMLGYHHDAILSMGESASLKAVPILIDFLADSGEQDATLTALWMLTHYPLPAAAGRTTLETQRAWKDWWTRNQGSARAYGPSDCEPAKPLG
jgi:HEAT repeats